MNKTILLAAVIGLSFSSQALTLDEALQLAVEKSPGLRAARAEAKAAFAGVRSATAWKNPELKLEAEGLGGNGGGSEYTAMVSQTFPLFGKTGRRRAVAKKAVEIRENAISEAELALTIRVGEAFTETLAQQEIAAIRNQQVELATGFVETARKRYEAGSASELEVVQAELALEEILMEQKCCFGDLDATKKVLASLLGVSLKEIGIPSGTFYELEKADAVQVRDEHPTLRRLRAQEERVRAEAAVARGQSVSDFSLGAGVKYETGDEAQSFVVAASIPLPVWGKGRAESASILLQAEAINARREQMHRELQQKLDKMVTAYRSALAGADQYKTRILPKAQKAYELSRKGYDMGRYSWMELLAAQQNLAEFKRLYIEAILVAKKTAAQLIQF